MKKAFSLFFLGIFLFNTAGYYLIYKITEYHIKNEIGAEIKAGINPSSLTIITVSEHNKNKIVWKEPGKEMRYNEQLYDVVKSINKPGNTIYYCLNDKKEGSLFASLDEHINLHVNGNKPLTNSKNLIRNIVKLYFSDKQHIEFNSTESCLSFIYTNLIFPVTSIKKDAPPPEFA